jgi:ribosomal protein L37AE/L43A
MTEVLENRVAELEKTVDGLKQEERNRQHLCDHKYQRTISTSIVQCEKCGKTLVWCFGLGWQ